MKIVKAIRANESDLKTITELVAAYYQEEKLVDPHSVSLQKNKLSQAIARKLKNRKRHFYYLFYRENELIGLVQTARLTPKIAELILIYILPPFRRQGWGRRILDWILSKLKKQGVKIVRTEIRNNNQASQKLFAPYRLTPYSTTYIFSLF